MRGHKNMKFKLLSKNNTLTNKGEEALSTAVRAYRSRGFILPMTLLVCSIILTVATGISVILAKELYFSKVSRESQLAYYAADDAMMCAIMVDDQYVDTESGIGIFPYNALSDNPLEDVLLVLDKVNIERQSRNLSSLVLNDIKCATAPIFDNTISSITFTPDLVSGGMTSIYSMRMTLGDGTYRCALVSVYKTETYRQIISRGFSSCGGGASKPIERAIINTTEVE